MDIHQLKYFIKTEYAASGNEPALRRRLLDVFDQMLMLDLHGMDEIAKPHERKVMRNSIRSLTMSAIKHHESAPI